MTLKGYSAISVFLGKLDIHVFSQCNFFYQFTSLDIHMILGFVVPPAENYYWVSPRKISENFTFSPESWAVPTGLLRRVWFCFENLTLFKIFNEGVICRNNFCGNVISNRKHNTSTISMLIWTKWCSKSIQEKVTIRKIIV